MTTDLPAAVAVKKPPNPLVNIAINIVIPSLVLSKLSKPEALGPVWSLVLACALPLGYGLWEIMREGKVNGMSVFGLAAILVSGILGLLNVAPVWMAVKEAFFPLLLGIFVSLSPLFGKPLIKPLFFNPQIMNLSLLENGLKAKPERQGHFNDLLKKGCWMLGGMCLFSAVAQFILALWLFQGKEPGSPDYRVAQGTMNWAQYVVVLVPMMALMFFILRWIINGTARLIGVEPADLTQPGETVRQQWKSGEKDQE